jgi:hypothetical protein
MLTKILILTIADQEFLAAKSEPGLNPQNCTCIAQNGVDLTGRVLLLAPKTPAIPAHTAARELHPRPTITQDWQSGSHIQREAYHPHHTGP